MWTDYRGREESRDRVIGSSGEVGAAAIMRQGVAALLRSATCTSAPQHSRPQKQRHTLSQVVLTRYLAALRSLADGQAQPIAREANLSSKSHAN